MFEVTHGGLLQILLSSGIRHGALSLIASSEKKNSSTFLPNCIASHTTNNKINILCIIILTYSVVLNQVYNRSHNGMCQQGFEYSSLNYIQTFTPTVM